MFSNTLAALAVLGLGVNAQGTKPWPTDVKPWPAFIDPVVTPGQPVGDNMPEVGFGTWMLPNNDKGADAVARAIKFGFRHFDGATAYTNQQAVGKGIAKGLAENPNIKREDLWVTTKIWATRHKSPAVGNDANLQQLGLSYVDLALIHFPIGNSQEPKIGADGKPVIGTDGKPVMQVVAE